MAADLTDHLDPMRIRNFLVCSSAWRQQSLSENSGLVEWLNGIALHGKPILELRSVTCHMGSHSVTCHPTQVSTPCLNPSYAGRY